MVADRLFLEIRDGSPKTIGKVLRDAKRRGFRVLEACTFLPSNLTILTF